MRAIYRLLVNAVVTGMAWHISRDTHFENIRHIISSSINWVLSKWQFGRVFGKCFSAWSTFIQLVAVATLFLWPLRLNDCTGTIAVVIKTRGHLAVNNGKILWGKWTEIEFIFHIVVSMMIIFFAIKTLTLNLTLKYNLVGLEVGRWMIAK